MKPLTRSLCSGAIICSSLACLLPAAAADQTPLTQQVEQLHGQLQALEARVRQLEQQHTAAAPAAQPVTSVDPALQSLGRLKEAWKGITAGMSTAQVRERLGEPARQFAIDGKPVWYYSYPGVGNGSVMFSTNGQVAGAQNPPFGFW